MTYIFVPFMFLPIYASVEKLDRRLLEASADLGAGRFMVWREVELPLAMPGILIGMLLTFVLAVGAVAEAKILGGQSVITVVHDIEIAFTYAQDWPLGAALDVLLALIIGIAMFKRRVGDVYFSIVTQAIAAILTILIIGQQGLTGGVNGITDLKTLLGWDIRDNSAKVILYFVNAFLLLGCILIGRFVLTSKLGRLLMAMRDKEERVRFSGYDVASFKIFVFCLAAAFSAIGGAMFALQVGFMSPSFVGIVPSIEMVIFAAVGGRMSLLGAVYGTLLVSFGKTYFSESFPELWLYLMGGLFIVVVMYFPNGIAGLWESHGRKWVARFPLGKQLFGVPPPKVRVFAAKPPAASPARELETAP